MQLFVAPMNGKASFSWAAMKIYKALVLIIENGRRLH
jgi:hypothetical protein